jgi:hypothetical protein
MHIIRPFVAGRQIIPAVFCLCLLFLAHSSASSQTDPDTEDLSVTDEFLPAPVRDVFASDNPRDEGGQILIGWEIPPEHEDMEGVTGYTVLRSEKADGPFEEVGTVETGVSTFIDTAVRNKKKYYYRIRTDGPAGTFSSVSGPAVASIQWFYSERLNILIGVIIYSILLITFISKARKGKDLFVRRIAGLEAIDDAVGRATEMGKPILYVPGLSTISDVATLASLNILGRVARKIAQYESRIIVPNRDPVVMPVCQEVVKEAFAEAGRPDAYTEDDIFYITNSQFGFVAAVDGIMLRERPATNFYLGMFWAESLILAETGAATGAIQIAGTDAVTQLPFFITACDYTLIGEELYAASAYLSREPLQLGSLKGQDWAKFLLAVLIIIGVITATFGLTTFVTLFE